MFTTSGTYPWLFVKHRKKSKKQIVHNVQSSHGVLNPAVCSFLKEAIDLKTKHAAHMLLEPNYGTLIGNMYLLLT